MAIETWLHRIPGLAEHFLYFNDDLFLGSTLPKEALFSATGRPVFFVERHPLAPRSSRFRRRTQEDLVMRCHRHNHGLLRDKLKIPLDARRPSHVPQLYRKSLLTRLCLLWRPEVEATRRNRFRTPRDLKIGVLYPYFAAESGEGEPPYLLRTLWNGSSEYVFKTIRDGNAGELEGWLEHILETRPTFFCLNDAMEREDVVERAGALMTSALARYFPAPSSFEIPGAG
jgi:hypothetical protein